ncbi:GNAT family N-acetyltransferase [Mycolicibacterium mageritense]|uniref:GNAT family N-acetyltransferase n=1 Tax=Mycolicibacterium mageritense TaxID=53462 RepID=UPI0011D9022C|nr:GNAT family N-acetyltransferase [Mycolicibacterium mageritense]TXI55217.1 MAG: GNAT family N-acetyltransferase [Mycolicibacterium mageritense]
MSHAPIVSVRPLEPQDETHWRILFGSYREFYRLEPDEAVTSKVWDWLMDPQHECEGVVALFENNIVAIGHYQRFSLPSAGTVGIFLDDLFTSPAARGKGAARAIIRRLVEIAGSEGLSLVRWTTAADNHQAQALYNQVATRTHWVTYDAAPSTSIT